MIHGIAIATSTTRIRPGKRCELINHIKPIHIGVKIVTASMNIHLSVIESTLEDQIYLSQINDIKTPDQKTIFLNMKKFSITAGDMYEEDSFQNEILRQRYSSCITNHRSHQRRELVRLARRFLTKEKRQ